MLTKVGSWIEKFLSTPSARRATTTRTPSRPRHKISIHALREEGDRSSVVFAHKPFISIHALREEGDNPAATYESIAYNFYPRPPRGGRRPACIALFCS